MEFRELVEQAKTIRQRYADYETARYGQAWTNKDLALGFVGDVGDLMKLVQAMDRSREIPDARARLEHELADCLWSVIVLAERFDIDLEQAFILTMNELEQQLSEIED